MLVRHPHPFLTSGEAWTRQIASSINSRGERSTAEHALDFGGTHGVANDFELLRGDPETNANTPDGRVAFVIIELGEWRRVGPLLAGVLVFLWLRL
ncbi:hypothetical protein ACCUM_1950 [Candidatus Accumulibacter phosphatis]|uniref:Uncharacterized protein n=1 Tax=Candidatus Accumulibacter phosphatis TaxID=327160 RepID=A0A5S4EIH6_9PROT|nr:hypothetical protein ACCUM_1950 [Candidatus Accumulibacter phosphatis]